MKQYQWPITDILMLISIFFVITMLSQTLSASITLPAKSAPLSGAEQQTHLEARLTIPATVPTPTPPTQKPLPFKVGERLEFSVKWGNISAGTVTMSVQDLIDYQGKQVYQMVVTAESNRAFSVFYRVHDVLESLVDAEKLFTRRYWTKQEEGNYKQERMYEFDHENNNVLYKDRRYHIRYGIQDEISAVYYVRTLDVHVGTPVYVDVFAKRQNWQVKCAVLKRETLSVPAGEFTAILIEPELQFDGLMKKGKFQIWLTDDEHRMPVKVQTHVAIIGSISLQLEKYTLGK